MRVFNAWNLLKQRPALAPLTVMLTDADPFGDDAIATVKITTHELRQALLDGKVRFVHVGEQSANQLLLVAVSVTAEGWSPE